MRWSHKNLISGHYFDYDGEINYHIWTSQTFVWVGLVVVVKLFQLYIEYRWADFFYDLGDDGLALWTY